MKKVILSIMRSLLKVIFIVSILVGIYAFVIMITKYSNSYGVDYIFNDRSGYVKYQEFRGYILFECIKADDPKLKIYDAYGLPTYNGMISTLDFRSENDVRIGTGPFEICHYTIGDSFRPYGSLSDGFIYIWPIHGWKGDDHKAVEIPMEWKFVKGHIYFAKGDMKFNQSRTGMEFAAHGKLTRFAFILPCWLIAVVFGVIPGVFTVRPIYRYLFCRHPKGHCQNCGYDLRATPDRCPECGKVPEKTMGLKSAAPVQ